MDIRRNLLISALWISLLLVGCTDTAPNPQPSPSNVAQESTITLPALLAEPQRWSGEALTVIAPPAGLEQAQVLSLSPAVTQTAQANQAIWLTEPISIASQAELEAASGLRLHGVLSPPGAYGPDQQYAYQFTVDDTQALQAERTTLTNLVDNPRALDRILLTVEGTVLARGDSVLLVDQVTEQGVPTQNARQIKLSRAAIDQHVFDQLQQAGDVRWGAVRITGWWADATMTPLSTEVLAR